MLPLTTVIMLNRPDPEICGFPLPDSASALSEDPFPYVFRGGSDSDGAEGEGDGLADAIGEGMTLAAGEADG